MPVVPSYLVIGERKLRINNLGSLAGRRSFRPPLTCPEFLIFVPLPWLISSNKVICFTSTDRHVFPKYLQHIPVIFFFFFFSCPGQLVLNNLSAHRWKTWETSSLCLSLLRNPSVLVYINRTNGVLFCQLVSTHFWLIVYLRSTGEHLDWWLVSFCLTYLFTILI